MSEPSRPDGMPSADPGPVPSDATADHPAQAWSASGHPGSAAEPGPGATGTPDAASGVGRRGRALLAAGAAGLLGVGVVIGVVVGQATAGTAAADTGSTVTQPGTTTDGSVPGYGSVPDGGGGFGRFGGMPPGMGAMPSAPDGTLPDGSTDSSGTDPVT
jgi:hypothetical protein